VAIRYWERVVFNWDSRWPQTEKLALYTNTLINLQCFFSRAVQKACWGVSNKNFIFPDLNWPRPSSLEVGKMTNFHLIGFHRARRRFPRHVAETKAELLGENGCLFLLGRDHYLKNPRSTFP